jgi:hypothetical protein
MLLRSHSNFINKHQSCGHSSRRTCVAVHNGLLQPGGSSSTIVQTGRRELLASTAALIACAPAFKVAGAHAADSVAAGAAALPTVPKAALTPELQISKVIKGCWQLSGGHKGDKQTDRTAAAAAVEVSRPVPQTSCGSSSTCTRSCIL